MTFLDLMDEVDGRLTATAVKYPGSHLFILSFQKHVKYALKNPGKSDGPKLIRKGKQWLKEMSWKHPEFRDEFSRIVAAIEKFELGES